MNRRFGSAFFAILGYGVFCICAGIVALEGICFIGWKAYDYSVHGESSRENHGNISPAYANYSWAPEFWKEEQLRWKSQRASYVPFLIWGIASWHGKYVNTDTNEYGEWRRTINNIASSCQEPHTTSIWMFGGSTLYGTGVPDWATIPSYLSQILNTASTCARVTNFGVEGYGSDQEVMLLIAQLKAGRRPDILIFYDGVNDAYAGAVSPAIPGAHVGFERIKGRVEGALASRVDFLSSTSTMRTAKSCLALFGRKEYPASADIRAKAVGTLDNYEANLRIVRSLAQLYNFKLFCFWQPALIYGEKPLTPFERKIVEEHREVLDAHYNGNGPFRSWSTVYDEAARRSASDQNFVFLGRIFDVVPEPLYIDEWMHLAPEGNLLLAQTIAGHVRPKDWEK
ncbi:MAG TPA: SGNH/GDSL hydrolase family protein [Terriglobales bacterium]|jgi:hypothetical protein